MASFSNKTFKVWQSDLKRSHTFKSTNTITAMTQLNDLTLLISDCNLATQQFNLQLLNSNSFDSLSEQLSFKSNNCVTALKSFQKTSVQYVAVGNGSVVQLLTLLVSSSQLNNLKNT